MQASHVSAVTLSLVRGEAGSFKRGYDQGNVLRSCCLRNGKAVDGSEIDVGEE